MREGESVARVLAGSWRVHPPEPTFVPRDVEAVEQQLLASGSAGLGWWRIHEDDTLATSPVGQRLHDAFRLHTLHAGLHKVRLKEVLGAFDAAGVEPLLLKGWAAAGMYPERGMRPFGDIDLWVRPKDRLRADSIVAGLPPGDAVDLDHRVELTGMSVETMFEAADSMSIDDVSVRVLCEEDALRILALHFLGSGGWRPLSLCDVAVAVESRSDGFDWRRCLTGDRIAAGWVRMALALASALLGADIRQTPALSVDVPGWLSRAVQRAWTSPLPVRHNAIIDPLPSLRHPAGVMQGIGQRWIDPLSASVEMRVPLNALPRLPIQAAYSLVRLGRYLGSQTKR